MKIGYGRIVAERPTGNRAGCRSASGGPRTSGPVRTTVRPKPTSQHTEPTARPLPVEKGRVGWALANANSQLISIVDLNQLTGPPQCKLFEQKQLSLSLNSHRSVPNSNLPAYLHPGWASPKCKVTSLVLTKLLPPLNCTPPLTITDPIAAFTGLL